MFVDVCAHRLALRPQARVEGCRKAGAGEISKDCPRTQRSEALCGKIGWRSRYCMRRCLRC
ncbi:MAG: hypothetical protein ACLSGI_01625 [Butyricicoccaceae bacterium]